jgi:hypothetical protein
MSGHLFPNLDSLAQLPEGKRDLIRLFGRLRLVDRLVGGLVAKPLPFHRMSPTPTA